MTRDWLVRDIEKKNNPSTYLGLGVLVLLGAIPLPPLPLLVSEQGEVVVCHGSGRESPGSLEPRAGFQQEARKICGKMIGVNRTQGGDRTYRSGWQRPRA